jgi:hypothetical protein
MHGFSKRAVGLLGTRNFREDERFRQMSVPDHVTANFPQCFISSRDPLARQAVHDRPVRSDKTDSSLVEILPVTFDRCLEARDS